MDKRRKNMQLYNALRSARVEGMIDMINTIDYGCSELDVLGVYDGYRLERQINSYRAMKIALQVSPLKRYLLASLQPYFLYFFFSVLKAHSRSLE